MIYMSYFNLGFNDLGIESQILNFILFFVIFLDLYRNLVIFWNYNSVFFFLSNCFLSHLSLFSPSDISLLLSYFLLFGFEGWKLESCSFLIIMWDFKLMALRLHIVQTKSIGFLKEDVIRWSIHFNV